MGLPRLILLAILVGGGIWLWRRYSSRHSTVQPPAAKAMVRCAHCQVHIPSDRALQKNQHWYCCSQHLAQGPQAGD